LAPSRSHYLRSFKRHDETFEQLATSCCCVDSVQKSLVFDAKMRKLTRRTPSPVQLASARVSMDEKGGQLIDRSTQVVQYGESSGSKRVPSEGESKRPAHIVNERTSTRDRIIHVWDQSKSEQGSTIPRDLYFEPGSKNI
jgi:hypothetical protein